MSYPSKIATCCYCGTRSVLVLKGKTRHELACASCGAPLHELKQMPAARKPMRDTKRETVRVVEVPVYRDKPRKLKKHKKRKKSWTRKLASEIFDVVEDIFD